jgi:pentatricopeptide repeat protein
VSPRTCVAAAAVYYAAGDCRRAIEESRKALEFEPRHPAAFYYMGVSQLRLGLTAQALESFETAVRLGHGHAAALTGMVFALVKAGRADDALKVLDELKDRATRAEASPYHFAEVYLALGDPDKALAYLRRSYELHLPDMIGIGADPLFEALSDHPEFKRIVQSLALTPPPAVRS